MELSSQDIEKSLETLEDFLENPKMVANGWCGGIARSTSHMEELKSVCQRTGFHIINHFNKVESTMDKILLSYTDGKGKIRVWMKTTTKEQ